MFVQWGLGGGVVGLTLYWACGGNASPLHSPCFLEAVDFFYVFFGVYFYIDFLADVLICCSMFMSIYSYCSSTMPPLDNSSALIGRN